MRTFSRLLLLACLLAGSLSGTGAVAQSYPDRNVTLVVTSAAGALTDVLTRAVAQRLSQMWGQNVVVENRGGGGHTLAASTVLRADRDGYTLLSTETGFITSQPHLSQKLPYDPDKDFIPVAGYAGIPMGLLVHPSVPAKNVAELVALAKEKPGSVTYGTAGVGTALHTGALLFESLTGTKLTAVHYRGAAPALNDLVAGHINMVIMGPSVALPAVKAGNLRMLGFGSTQRVAQMPEVPTIAESVPGYEAAVSFGLFAAAGTPPAVVNKINADIQKIIADPEFRTKFLEPQVVQALPGPREAFAEYLRKDSAKWAKVIKAAGIKVD